MTRSRAFSSSTIFGRISASAGSVRRKSGSDTFWYHCGKFCSAMSHFSICS
ncbi:MAG: hypothetical protein HY812_13910 [Planctomycetes bacterium]|nr:hypothetical protein [Planctomycetota bacterium]